MEIKTVKEGIKFLKEHSNLDRVFINKKYITTEMIEWIKANKIPGLNVHFLIASNRKNESWIKSIMLERA